MRDRAAAHPLDLKAVEDRGARQTCSALRCSSSRWRSRLGESASLRQRIVKW
jgi:hypothetical protein